MLLIPIKLFVPIVYYINLKDDDFVCDTYSKVALWRACLVSHEQEQTCATCGKICFTTVSDITIWFIDSF